MALDRTNMVSLLDIGKLFGGASTDIVEMGDGYTEISEDWGPGIDSTPVSYTHLTLPTNSRV